MRSFLMSALSVVAFLLLLLAFSQRQSPGVSVADEIFRSVLSAATDAAGNDGRALALVSAFRDKVRVADIASRNEPHAFTPFYVVRSPADARALGVDATHASFHFVDGAFAFVARQEWSRWFLGAVALHEMSHWEDIFLTHREPFDASEDQAFLGEVRAHRLEAAAIDRMSGGRYLATIERALSDRRLSRPLNGTGLRSLVQPVGWDEVKRVLPGEPLSEDEAASLTASLLVTSLLVQCDTPEEELAAYRLALRTLGYP